MILIQGHIASVSPSVLRKASCAVKNVKDATGKKHVVYKSWISKCFSSLSAQLLQTFSSIAHEIFASVRVSTVPLLLVTSIILQLFFCSPTLSISDTKNVKCKEYCC